MAQNNNLDIAENILKKLNTLTIEIQQYITSKKHLEKEKQNLLKMEKNLNKQNDSLDEYRREIEEEQEELQVIDDIRIGVFNGLPNIRVVVSTSAKSISGRA